MLDSPVPTLQRTRGAAALSVGPHGIGRLREEAACRLRLPAVAAGEATEAVFINTAGGMTGGDVFAWQATATGGAKLCATTQAAEKIYRSLGDRVHITTTLSADEDSTLLWMPQETIIFDGARLTRSLQARMCGTSRVLIAEPIVFGRKAMGEQLSHFSLHDRWRIHRDGQIIHAEDLRMDETALHRRAALGGMCAMATLLLIDWRAEQLLESLRDVLGPHGGASAWNGKLVARLVAEDGYLLRKALIPALKLLAGARDVPKVWTI